MIYGTHYGTLHPIAVNIEQGCISELHELEALNEHLGHTELQETNKLDGAEVLTDAPKEHSGKLSNDKSLPYIAPGLIDLQINGYLGEDFNQLPLSEQSIEAFCNHMWRLGVVRFYPTLITNSFEALKEALETIAYVCERDEYINYAIAGIHLEGPFISPLDGARGAHDQQYVCPPSIDWMKSWQEASGNRVKIITMSPEWENSVDFISYCCQRGIVVSIGHTAATSQQIERAVEAGASLVTHFGNGVQLQLPRHPNYLWEQLAQDGLYTCIIADSYHLPKQVLKVVYEVKQQRTILVSDAVALAGSPPGSYTTFVGGEVILTDAGKLHLAQDERLLAGSVAALTDGVGYMHRSGIASFREAWHMASIHPAQLMKLPNAAGLKVEAPADFVLYEQDEAGHIVILQTYVQGRCMYPLQREAERDCN